MIAIYTYCEWEDRDFINDRFMHPHFGRFRADIIVEQYISGSGAIPSRFRAVGWEVL
jgi:hypothetical protein